MGRGVGRERGEGGGGEDRVRGKRENKWEITFRKWEILFEFPESKAQDSAQKVIYSTGSSQKSPGDVYTFNQKSRMLWSHVPAPLLMLV